MITFKIKDSNDKNIGSAIGVWLTQYKDREGGRKLRQEEARNNSDSMKTGEPNSPLQEEPKSLSLNEELNSFSEENSNYLNEELNSSLQTNPNLKID